MSIDKIARLARIRRGELVEEVLLNHLSSCTAAVRYVVSEATVGK